MTSPLAGRLGLQAASFALGAAIPQPCRFGSRGPVRVILLAGLLSFAPFLAEAQEAPETPAYVGSAECADCHTEETEAWSGSYHAAAWTLPDETTVLGDFDDAEFEHAGTTTRFRREGDAFIIETADIDGETRAFEVVGVAGLRPLQQYLLEPTPGRTQTFDIAWDVVEERWYPVFPDQQITPGDALHWSGPYKSWEARCAECHATGYSRNYRPESRTYAPEMSEIGVGCEACHGPGEAHVAMARSEGSPSADWGLTVDLSADATTQVEQCAACHSRREALADGNPLPGTPYHDSHSLALLRDGLYEADGTIRDEVYVYGSFLQSRMGQAGVRCSDCHDVHATELRAEGNAVCTQCHSPASDPRFETLTADLYDDPSHHFHPEGSEGAQCQSCHMPERVYMGIDARSDHSFRIPRPDIALRTGGPDTCTDCHTDRDAAWAAGEIAARFPDTNRADPNFATVFAAARWAPDAQIPELSEIAQNPEASAIVRSSALDLLAPVADAGSAAVLAPLLTDPEPLVRAAAAGVQRAAPAEERATRLAPVLIDPLRAVRVAAAKAMLGTDPAALPPDAWDAVVSATEEWQASLAFRQDFPETHLQLGGAALGLRDPAAAVAAFREAVALDPQLLDGWIMLARIHAAMGDVEAARAALEEALSANPEDPTLLALRRQL